MGFSERIDINFELNYTHTHTKLASNKKTEGRKERKRQNTSERGGAGGRWEVGGGEGGGGG